MEKKRKLVSIQTIKDIQPIENADKIEIAVIGGWNIVVRKGEFKKGDKVFYFEIDSCLPLSDNRFSFLEIHGKTFQNNILYHRLKTIKLRGQISQGLILPLSIWNNEDGDLEKIKKETNSFEEYFKVVKYEIPVKFSGNQKLTNWPEGLPHTDEERLQSLIEDWNFEDIKKEGNWYATEKIDGCSITMFCLYDPNTNTVQEPRVCSRNFELINTEEDPYWKVVREKKITRTLDNGEIYETSLIDYLKEKSNVAIHNVNFGICLQGELFGEGIQSNRLGVKGQHIRFYNLLIKSTEGWKQLPMCDVVRFYPELEKYWVPIMPEFRLPETVEEAINQPDGIKSHVPEADKTKQIEGIVWRLVDKNYGENGNKCSFKCISNKYLLKNE